MIYLKKYENINDKPKVGDYVLIDPSKFDELKDFFNSEIGKIFNVDEIEIKLNGYPYFIKFEKNIPTSIFGPKNDNKMAFKEKELLSWSNNKKNLKIKIDANKYNL